MRVFNFDKKINQKMQSVITCEKETMLECNKFIACLEKLTGDYTLFLLDVGDNSTTQVANENPIEFFEGYEIFPEYTNSVREQAVDRVRDIYVMILKLIDNYNQNENQNSITQIKEKLRELSNIILNIYTYLSMLNPPKIHKTSIIDEVEKSFNYEYLDAIYNNLLKLNKEIHIEHINRQLIQLLFEVCNLISISKDNN